MVIKNDAMIALEKIQDAFEGEAERLGLEIEEDIVKMIKEFRKEVSDKFQKYRIKYRINIESIG